MREKEEEKESENVVYMHHTDKNGVFSYGLFEGFQVDDSIMINWNISDSKWTAF
jgi:hypothetical protein